MVLYGDMHHRGCATGMRVAELKSGSVDTKFYENSGKAVLPADFSVCAYKRGHGGINQWDVEGGRKQENVRGHPGEAGRGLTSHARSPAKVWKGRCAGAIYWVTTLPCKDL
jgi:hypothetical protein